MRKKTNTKGKNKNEYQKLSQATEIKITSQQETLHKINKFMLQYLIKYQYNSKILVLID